MRKKEIQERLDFAKRIARKAGDCALKYFQKSSLAVETKGNDTPVSRADKEAELILRKQILKHYPGESIIGEEHGVEGKSDIVWILDPIDGTESFIRGVPLFGNLIGLEVAGKMVLGVANMPALGEMVYAGAGLGAWWVNKRSGWKRPNRARVSKTTGLKTAMTCFSGGNYFRQANCMGLIENLMNVSKNTRGWGDCYGHLLVATGRADASVDPYMEVWDSAALLPILEEAGGKFTDFSGKPDIRGRSAVSTNGILHDEYLRIVQEHHG